jgi:DNA-directed RNA polymerase III subunit RPC2
MSLGQGHRVILDGIIIGYTFNPQLVDRIRLLRRKGLVEKFVNVAMIKGKNEEFGEIMINTDSGRLVRPLLILDKGRILLTSEMVQELDEGKASFDDLVGRGVIEFLDVNEEDNAFIAVTAAEITPNHTHLEIDPFTIIGVVAGIIPYPHHNQSPRNLFQCSMGKQAQGIIGLNELVRNDTVNYLLTYPQQPMVKTAHIELINYNKLPAGQNASVAVMSYSGYDIEDAIIVNKASLDRGFERSFYYRRFNITNLDTKTN